MKLDEVRFGASYYSVLAGNQPMTADTAPPIPNPVGFHTPPVAASGTSIHMRAVTAYDPNGVEYYFTCTAGGGNNSGWQDSPVYTDTGLNPSTQYYYRACSYDNLSNASSGATACGTLFPKNKEPKES